MKKLLTTLIGGSALLALLGCVSTAPQSSSQTAGTLKIGGSSEAYEILEALADGYRDTASNIEFEFSPPSQTSAGIEGVKTRLLDIGGLSRPITGAEASEGLKYFSLSDVPLVMVVHESVTGVSDITADQIKAIYLGEITNWQELGGPNAEIVLLDFTEDENEKQLLRQAYLGETLEVTPEAIVFAEDDELIESVATTDFAFAAVPLEDEIEELPLTVLSIDSVEPSEENIQSGDYLMSIPLGMVLSKTPSPVAEDFVAFVKSEEGQQILQAAEDDDSEAEG